MILLADTSSRAFRSFFARTPGQRLSSIHSDFITNKSVDACAEKCVQNTHFRCKSFDYDNLQRACFLFDVNLDDADVRLIDFAERDHYETSYATQFNRLPKHRLPVRISKSENGVSVEECARMCIWETYFRCRGFNYRGIQSTCSLLDLSPETSTAAVYSADEDYYQTTSEGPLSSFINYGMGRLRPLQNFDVYEISHLGISVTQQTRNIPLTLPAGDVSLTWPALTSRQELSRFKR
ncbi:hypothetical protein CAPTEDRAFT_192306 [Capitella teleta]|uniref:Apple domain-containing protein n=1 Tax=Capitella teleta TaxID=283909 RepID=R7VEG9_CAPTE|nr:hypothetical protein CAPTEDRAFT_192306 [Capitella teleta]|eukprot:ELU14666.1 hypothetical protein CAPTEDRAFT_192306 [Capitella teleta]